jgi:hypothetical protein
MLTKDEITIICDSLIATYGEKDNEVKDALLAKIRLIEEIPEQGSTEYVRTYFRNVLGMTMRKFLEACGWKVSKTEDGMVVWKPPKGYRRPKRVYDFQHAVYSQIYRDREEGFLTIDTHGGLEGALSNHQRNRQGNDDESST